LLMLLLLLLCRRLGGGDGFVDQRGFLRVTGISAIERGVFVIERGFSIHEFRLWMCMVGMRSMAEDRIG
jgi:hypothetical protein